MRFLKGTWFWFLLAWFPIPASAGPQDDMRAAFFSGDIDSTIRLADEKTLRAQRESDNGLLADALFWRGLASAAQGQDSEADRNWTRAMDAAKRGKLSDEQVLIQGVRSVVGFTNFSAVLAATHAEGATSTTNRVLLDLLGIVEGRQIHALLPSRQAFKRSLELLQKSNAPAAQQAVARYNLAVSDLILPQTYALNLDLDEAILRAHADFEAALAGFQLDTNTLGMACCQFQLAWLAYEIDDNAAVERWSAEFKQSVGKLGDVNPRGLKKLKSAYLLFTASSPTPKIETVAMAETDEANSSLFRAFEHVNGVGAIASGLVEDRFAPLKSFLWLWQFVCDPANAQSAASPGSGDLAGLPGMDVSAALQKAEHQMEQMGAHLTEEQKTKMRDEFAKAQKMLTEKMKTDPNVQAAVKITKAMDRGDANPFGQQVDLVFNQLPGGSPLQAPAMPLSMITDANSRIPNARSIPALDTAKPLSDDVSGSIWSWGLMRRVIYGERLAAQGNGRNNRTAGTARGLTYASLVFGSPYLTALPVLLRVGENRAAWQVVEESWAAPMRVEAQLGQTLESNKGLRASLIAAEQKGIQAHMQYVRERQSVAGTDKRAIEGAELTHIQKLWEESQADYDGAFSQAVEDNFKGVPELMTAGEAARIIPTNAVYVSFSTSMAVDNGYVFLLDPRKNPGQPEVLVESMSLPMGIVSRFQRAAYTADSDLGDFPRLGRRLFERLFPGTVGERIRGASRIILTPPNSLWSFPFAALVVNESNAAPRFLGLDKSVSYIDSIAQLQQCRKRPAPATLRPEDILIIGGIPYNQPEQRPVFERFQASGLPELERSAVEAKEVAAVYGAQSQPGETATEPLVRSRIERAPIVHIATHGYRGNTMSGWDFATTPESVRSSLLAGTPGIWLDVRKPATEPGFSEDGLLQAWEVKNELNLKSTDLIVLSACDVGHAKSVVTYGPELPLACLRAGAASVVAVQAVANDRSTAWLMPRFHKLLRQGIHKDDALRQALVQLQAQADFHHPAYWAPFILLGDPDNSLFTKK